MHSRRACCAIRWTIEVAARNATAERIEQHVYRVPKDHKRHLLAHLIKSDNWQQVLVFTRTKHGANRLCPAATGRGHQRRRDPRQQEPGSARARAE